MHEVQQYEGEYTESTPPDNCFVLPVCMKCDEHSAHILNKIVELTKKCSAPHELSNYENIIAVLGIFSEISGVYLKSNTHIPDEPLPSSLSNKIKQIISENIHTSISINDIAKKLHRSPNYINTVFRQTENTTIRQYINKEKTLQIVHHMSNEHLPFRTACEKVGIFDTSYGYRMFKKFTGTTPGMYLQMTFNDPEKHNTPTHNTAPMHSQ